MCSYLWCRHYALCEDIKYMHTIFFTIWIFTIFFIGSQFRPTKKLVSHRKPCIVHEWQLDRVEDGKYEFVVEPNRVHS